MAQQMDNRHLHQFAYGTTHVMCYAIGCLDGNIGQPTVLCTRPSTGACDVIDWSRVRRRHQPRDFSPVIVSGFERPTTPVHMTDSSHVPDQMPPKPDNCFEKNL